MLRRRGMDCKAATPLGLLVVALAPLQTEGSIFDTPADELGEDDFAAYGNEVLVASMGLGIGPFALFGVLAFVAMLAMCCRCNRLHREDLAIAQAEGNNDGKGLDAMYEIEDYENRISKHRKILWILSFIIFLSYIFCAGYAYNGAKSSKATFDDIFDGTDVLLTEIQTALCAENGAKECADQSVGDFLLNIATEVVDQFEGIVIFLSSLTTVVLPLYWVSANLTTAATVINGTERAALNLNTSITNVNLIFTGDGNVADISGGSTLPTLDDSILEDVAEGRRAIAAAKTLTGDSTVEVAEQLSGSSSSITRIKYQLDDVHGNEIEEDEDLRNTTLEAVYEVLVPLRDTARDVYDFQNNELVDAREIVDAFLELSVQAVGAIIFLPGVVLLLTAICSGICQSSKPLYLNMCFVFLSQILFCLMAGVFLAVSKINGDVCDHHLQLIEINFQEEYNTTVKDTAIFFNFDKLYLILKCDGVSGDTPTSTNNFVGILGAEQVFNMSKMLKASSNMIKDNTDALASPKITVVQAQGELSPLNDFVDMEIGDDEEIEESSDEIDDLLNEIPPTPFNWDSRADQDALDDFYLKNVTEFSWNNATTGDELYRSLLGEINKIISKMEPGVIQQSDFDDIDYPYNFTLARNLTWMTVCAETSNFFPDPADLLTSNLLGIIIYSDEDQWGYLCGNVSAYANITVKLEDLIFENGETRLDLEEVSGHLDDIGGNLTAINGYQVQMGLLRDDMNDSLIHLIEKLDELGGDLNNLATDIESLNDHFMAASSYTMCGYIGTFYEDVYLDAMCTDLQGNVEAVAGPALCVVILMFLSFCVQGCYGPSMRKRPRHTADPDGSKVKPTATAAGETRELNKVAGNKTGLSIVVNGEMALNTTADESKLPTPHSPTPLVGDSGF